MITISDIEQIRRIVQDNFSKPDLWQIQEVEMEVTKDNLIGSTWTVDLCPITPPAVLKSGQVTVDTAFSGTVVSLKVGVDDDGQDSSPESRLLFLESLSSTGTTQFQKTGIISPNHNIVKAKFSCLGGGNWTSQANSNYSRYGGAGAGTGSSGLNFAGYQDGYGYITASEKFNGSSWSVVGSLNAAKFTTSGCGSQSAACCIAGRDSSGNHTVTCEQYNGSTWASMASISANRSGNASVGTELATATFGGYNGSTLLSSTELWNGVAWSTSGSLSVPRQTLAGAGSKISALGFGGVNASSLTTTEEFNGLTWSTGGNLGDTNTYSLGGAGEQSAALRTGGAPLGTPNSPVQTCSIYDGTSWYASSILLTARRSHSCAGTSSSALVVCGIYIGGTNLSASETFSPGSLGMLTDGKVTINLQLAMPRS